MLSNREKKLLARELEKVKAADRLARGDLMPEEEKFFKNKFPGGGSHVHDEDNPFGMHRHFLDDEIDAPHTHSPQNPGGEHAHGEFEGRALIDGKHYHNNNDTGYHHHSSEESNGENPIPQKPDGVL